MTLLAVGDFLRFKSLDGLFFGAIGLAAVAIVSDGVVAWCWGINCWRAGKT
jgi:hypothetical protein